MIVASLKGRNMFGAGARNWHVTKSNSPMSRQHIADASWIAVFSAFARTMPRKPREGRSRLAFTAQLSHSSLGLNP